MNKKLEAEDTQYRIDLKVTLGSENIAMLQDGLCKNDVEQLEGELQNSGFQAITKTDIILLWLLIDRLKVVNG